MTEVNIRDVLRLSPETVRRVSTERTVLHRRPETRQREEIPLEVRRISPLIMDAALRLTGGDVSRISMRDDGSVVILNHSRPGVSKSAAR